MNYTTRIMQLSSLSGTFLALHATIENVVLVGTTPLDLAQNRIFFYSHNYIIPKHNGGYGRLEPIIAPSLQSSEWPEPDVWSVMALKQKIVSDIHVSLKFGKASRSKLVLSYSCVCAYILYSAIHRSSNNICM